MSLNDVSKSKSSRSFDISGIVFNEKIILAKTSNYASFVVDYDEIGDSDARFTAIREPIQKSPKVTFAELKSAGVNLDASDSDTRKAILKNWAQFKDRALTGSNAEVLLIAAKGKNSIVCVIPHSLAEFAQVKTKIDSK